MTTQHLITYTAWAFVLIVLAMLVTSWAMMHYHLHRAEKENQRLDEELMNDDRYDPKNQS